MPRSSGRKHLSSQRGPVVAPYLGETLWLTIGVPRPFCVDLKPDHLGMGMHEWYPEAHTCETGITRARIDRLYCNQHLVDQLDRSCECGALSFPPGLSSHRPISFARRIPNRQGCAPRGRAVVFSRPGTSGMERTTLAPQGAWARPYTALACAKEGDSYR